MQTKETDIRWKQRLDNFKIVNTIIDKYYICFDEFANKMNSPD